MTTVAWLGLGAMGSRMALRLVRAGHEVVVWNRSRARAEELAGARVAATPADAVRHADLVVSMPAGPTAVREVGPAIAAEARAGTTVIDMSTIGPDTVTWLRDELPDGVTLLDAPVLGSVAEAEEGTLTLLVGGPDDAVARWTPLLSELGRLVHLGPSGAGAAAKLVANNALIGTLGVLAESLSLADGLGLPRDVAWQVLGLTPLADQARRRRPAIDSGSYPPRFALSLALKDAGLIVAAAENAGRRMPLARAGRAWLAEADAAGRGGEDYTALLGHILGEDQR
ncbi:NAD(P)-dependent oxidoreductase [Nonomuraea sp. CA-218870]|uniref:NAD(P)-dependent oxidoreductase n=1 Tax=Nonomuraea sp. CA-218870 TaxID=3239998 RepID=UPI003D913D4D